MKYIKGIIGAIIGGLIGCIPWILSYLYLNMMFSFLAIFIAYGALYGYRLFQGFEDEFLPRIIIMTSFGCVTLSMMVIIPSIALYNEGIKPTLKLLEEMYSNNKILMAFFLDYAIAAIFTYMGISSTIKKIEKEIEEKNQQ